MGPNLVFLLCLERGKTVGKQSDGYYRKKTQIILPALKIEERDQDPKNVGHL